MSDGLNIKLKLFPGADITISSYSEDFMISRLDFEPHIAAPVHCHPEDEVNICLSGEFICEVDGIAYALMAGDSIHIGSDQKHRLVNLGQPGVVATVWGRYDKTISNYSCLIPAGPYWRVER